MLISKKKKHSPYQHRLICLHFILNESHLFTGPGRISLAQAHAKLSLRAQVLEEDAVIAVLLCEGSVTLKHGLFPQLLC